MKGFLDDVPLWVQLIFWVPWIGLLVWLMLHPFKQLNEWGIYLSCWAVALIILLPRLLHV